MQDGHIKLTDFGLAKMGMMNKRQSVIVPSGGVDLAALTAANNVELKKPDKSRARMSVGPLSLKPDLEQLPLTGGADRPPFLIKRSHSVGDRLLRSLFSRDIVKGFLFRDMHQSPTAVGTPDYMAPGNLFSFLILSDHLALLAEVLLGTIPAGSAECALDW